MTHIATFARLMMLRTLALMFQTLVCSCPSDVLAFKDGTPDKVTENQKLSQELQQGIHSCNRRALTATLHHDNSVSGFSNAERIHDFETGNCLRG